MAIDISKKRNYAEELDKNYRQVLGTSDTSITAFGQQKVSIDKSLLSMIWTYDIPRRGNKELIWDGSDFIEQASFVNATSVKGALNLSSSTTENQRVQLRSLQHVRYQANRGYLYSTSIILPNPTANGVRCFGAFIPSNGVFIEVVGTGTKYFVNLVIRNHWSEDRIDITKELPEDVDLSKGNLFDIQMEWRGIGNYKVFFNLKLIYHHHYVGTLEQTHMENPSLPVAYECINTGDEVILISGCADISSEGGDIEKRYYGSVSSGTSLVNVTKTNDKGTAVIAFRLPKTIEYGELVNGSNSVDYTRDTVLDAVTSFCKDESFTIVSASRGVYVPNLSNVTKSIDPLLGWARGSDSYVEYMIGGVGSVLETAFQLDEANMRLLHASRHEIDMSAVIPNPNPETTPFFVTSDSYIIVSIKPDGANKQAGCNIEYSEII